MSLKVEYMLPVDEDELVALFMLMAGVPLDHKERQAIEKVKRKMQDVHEGR